MHKQTLKNIIAWTKTLKSDTTAVTEAAEAALKVVEDAAQVLPLALNLETALKALRKSKNRDMYLEDLRFEIRALESALPLVRPEDLKAGDAVVMNDTVQRGHFDQYRPNARAMVLVVLRDVAAKDGALTVDLYDPATDTFLDEVGLNALDDSYNLVQLSPARFLDTDPVALAEASTGDKDFNVAGLELAMCHVENSDDTDATKRVRRVATDIIYPEWGGGSALQWVASNFRASDDAGEIEGFERDQFTDLQALCYAAVAFDLRDRVPATQDALCRSLSFLRDNDVPVNAETQDHIDRVFPARDKVAEFGADGSTNAADFMARAMDAPVNFELVHEDAVPVVPPANHVALVRDNPFADRPKAGLHRVPGFDDVADVREGVTVQGDLREATAGDLVKDILSDVTFVEPTLNVPVRIVTTEGTVLPLRPLGAVKVPHTTKHQDAGAVHVTVQAVVPEAVAQVVALALQDPDWAVRALATTEGAGTLAPSVLRDAALRTLMDTNNDPFDRRFQVADILNGVNPNDAVADAFGDIAYDLEHNASKPTAQALQDAHKALDGLRT